MRIAERVELTNKTQEKFKEKAIEEFSDLGAGFRLALRDLEIRGAGNILGPEQSGHLAAVGYDFYCRMMERAVRELRNEPVAEPEEVSIALGLETYVPEAYVGDPASRIELYRKLHRAAASEDLKAIRDEARDRFGPLPPQAEALLAEARLRQLAQRLNVRAISLEAESSDRRAGSSRYPLVVNAARIAPVAALLESRGHSCRVIDDNTLHLRLKPQGADERAARAEPEVLVSLLIAALEDAAGSPDAETELR